MDKLNDTELLRIIATFAVTSPRTEQANAQELNKDVLGNYYYQPMDNWEPLPENVNSYSEDLFQKFMEEATARKLIKR